MSRIDDLIQQLCPNGVEFRELGTVVALRFGERVTKLKDTGTQYPVYGGGGESFRVNKFNREDEYVVSRFAMSETCVRRVRGKFWMLDSGFTFDPSTNEVLKDYVAYWLFNSQRAIYACSSQGAQKNLRTDEFRRFRIPVPPLKVQREIVKVLNLFQSLEAELEAELEARRRQYAHYRDSLLAFSDSRVRWVTLGELGEVFRGRRFVKSDYVDVGIDSIHYGEIYTHYGTVATTVARHVRPELAGSLRFAQPGDVVIAEVGETVEDVGKAVAWLGTGQVAVHDGCFVLRHQQNPTYVAYCLQTSAFHAEKSQYVARAKLKRLSFEGLKRLSIPIPPLDEQERIVAILDRFDALVNDLSIGLPAELTARRKQYEYYRDRLLTFEEAA